MSTKNEDIFENLDLSLDAFDKTEINQNFWEAEDELQKAVPPSEKDIPPMIKSLGKSSDYLNIGLENGQVNISYNQGKLSQYRTGNITFDFSNNGKYTKSCHNYEHSIQYDSDGRKLREVMENVEFLYSDTGKVKVAFYNNEDKERISKLMKEVAEADNIDKYQKPKDGKSYNYTPMEQRFIDSALGKRAKEMVLASHKSNEAGR